MTNGHITPDIAAHVLWHFNHGEGAQPDDATAAVLERIATASPADRMRLDHEHHPGYIAACELYQRTSDGPDLLRARAIDRLAHWDGGQ